MQHSSGVAYPAREAIVGIFARLKMGGVHVSPELVKETVMHGRSLEDWQIRDLESIMRSRDLPRDIAHKEGQIKKENKSN